MWAALFCSVLALLFARVLWRRWKYDLHKVPSPPGLPVLGHTVDFLYGDGIINFVRWVGKSLKHLNYPKLMRIELMGRSLIVVTDEEFLKTVMLTNRNPFPRFVENGTYLLPMIGDNMKAKAGILHAEVMPYVKAVRSIYTSAFQSSNLKTAVPKIQKTIEKMIAVIEDARENGPIDVQRLFVSLSLDTIGDVAFDKNFGGLDKSGDLLDLMLAAGYIAKEEFYNPMKRIYCKVFPNSKAGRHRKLIIGKLTEEWKKLTNEILAREDPADGEKPMWYGLKHLVDPETKKHVAHEVLLTEVGGVVVAGMDTTGHQLGWIVALLATRPDIVDKILDELKHHGLYGKESRDVQFGNLSDLVYLTAVIKEGMRAADITSGSLTQITPRDMTILGYRIPKGTTIQRVGARAFNVDVDWDDPENFKPERWLDDGGFHQQLISPFSTGARDCVGQKLAMLQMRLTIIALLTKYKVSLVGSYTDLVSNSVTGVAIEAKDGIWLNFTLRTVPL